MSVHRTLDKPVPRILFNVCMNMLQFLYCKLLWFLSYQYSYKAAKRINQSILNVHTEEKSQKNKHTPGRKKTDSKSLHLVHDFLHQHFQ